MARVYTHLPLGLDRSALETDSRHLLVLGFDGTIRNISILLGVYLIGGRLLFMNGIKRVWWPGGERKENTGKTKMLIRTKGHEGYFLEQGTLIILLWTPPGKQIIFLPSGSIESRL